MLFRCEDMVGKLCKRHFDRLQMSEMEPRQMQHERKYAIKGVEDYDKRRGFGCSEYGNLLENVHSVKKTIFTPSTPPVWSEKEAAELLDDKTGTQAKLDIIGAHCPAAARALDALPPSNIFLLYELRHSIAALYPSVDLTRQFEDWAGDMKGVTSHQEPSVGSVPTYLQFRFSTHLLSLAVSIAAIHLHARFPNHDSLVKLGNPVNVLGQMDQSSRQGCKTCLSLPDQGQ